jgi:hypothetical protein
LERVASPYYFNLVPVEEKQTVNEEGRKNMNLYNANTILTKICSCHCQRSGAYIQFKKVKTFLKKNST